MPNAIKVGNEILVNTTIQSAQEAPAIRGLPGGGFVVTWTDFSQTGGDTSIGTVRAQIFNADGSRNGGELLLPTTTSSTQHMSVIAALSEGRFVVAWTDESRSGGDPSGAAVRAQVLKTDGSKVGTEFIIPTTTVNHQEKPALATLTDGRFVAAWSDASSGGDIRARIFDLDGTHPVGEFLVNTMTASVQDEPTVAALPGGRFVVAWSDQSATGSDMSGAAIRAQLFDADGLRVGAEFVVNTTTAGSQLKPAITGLSDGRFVATWTDFSFSPDDNNGAAVRMQVFDANGTRSGAEILLNHNTAGNQQHPVLAALPEGRFVAAWADGSGTTATLSEIRAQLFDSDGSRMGPEFTANTTIAFTQWKPAITALADGRIAMAWEDQSTTSGDTSNNAIRAQIFDLCEPPVITSGGTALVAENTNAVMTVTATDADSSSLTFEIVGGVDASHFQIDHATGVLSFIAAPDYDAPDDQNGDNTYELDVRVTDGTQQDEQTIAIIIGNVNEAPHITSNGGGDGASFTVAENQTAVTTVTASDPDAGSALQYSIAGGADAALFDIDTVTGAVSFNAAPDYEALASNHFELVVRASDGTLTADQLLQFKAYDVNDAPDITSDGGGATASLLVNEDTTAVTTVTASDQDADTVLTYSIVGGGSAGLLQIDATTGALSLKTLQDYDVLLPGENQFSVVVRASDGTLATDQLIQFSLANVNEAPAITSNEGGAASVTVAENGTAVTTVAASDPDAGSTIAFSIVGGADAARFQIDASTGALAFVAAPDFEAPADADHDNIYQVVVRASDGALSDEQAFSVAVSDLPDGGIPSPAVKSGGEFVVNTGAGMQNQPAMASFTSGQFVAVWTEWNVANATNRINAQIFDAHGDKAGGEIVVNTNADYFQHDAVVTTLSDGRFVVAWDDYRYDDVAYEVRAQIFNPDGTRSGPQFTVNNTSLGNQSEPSIARLPDDSFMVIWSDWTEEEGLAIRAQRFGSDGAKAGDDFVVEAAPDIGNAVVAAAGDRYLVTWRGAGEADGTAPEIQARILGSDGVPIGPRFVVNTTIADTQFMPTMTALANGPFVVAWNDWSATGGDTDSTAVRAQVLDSAGAKLGAEFLVNTTTVAIQYDPAVAALPDGRFVIAWTDTSATGADTSGSAIIAQVFNSDGTKAGGELTVNTTTALDQVEPTITALADGRFVIGWTDDGDSADNTAMVRGQIFDARQAAVHLIGTGRADDLLGTAFDDTMRGNGSNGGLAGAAHGGRNDHLDGAGGEDTAVFTHGHAHYAVQALASGDVVVWNAEDGTTVLSNFEHVVFADLTLDLDDLAAGNHNPAQIVSNGGGLTAMLSVSENTTAVTTVSAVDPDAGAAVTYAIAGGADAGRFVINATTGVLSFAAAPDFETPADSDHDNGYVVKVTASDGSWTDSQTLTVNVTDVNEAPQDPTEDPPEDPPEDQMVWLIGTPGNDVFAALPGNERIDGLGASDTVSFNFKLTEATITYAGNQVIIDSVSSHTVLSGFEVFAFTDGTVYNNDGSPLVDDLFYYSRNHDVWAAQMDADAHYNVFGWHEGRDANAFFSVGLSHTLYQDTHGLDPLLHFDQLGWLQGRLPAVAFDGAAYLAANPDVAAAHVDPLFHFLLVGAEEGRLPVAADGLFAADGFDSLYYLAHNPDVAAAHVDPLWHFRTVGWHEGRNPNAHFDTAGYLNAYADVAAAGINPFDHYNLTGWHEGRDPSIGFDTTAYLAANPDVADAQVNPLTHYLVSGIHEGRSPMADGVWG